MKKTIMVRAHEIAKNLDGDYVARMSLALRQAWVEARKPAKATITTTSGSRKHKSWVAQIVGTHTRFGLDRQFVDPVTEGWFDKDYELADGYYEVCNAGDRRFIRVANGQVATIGKDEVVAVVA